MKSGVILLSIALCALANATEKRLKRTAVSKVRDVVEAVLFGEERLEEIRRNIPENEGHPGEDMFVQTERSKELESQTIVGIEATKRLMERTGMTKKELIDDEVIDLAFRQLVCPEPAIDCNTILADPVKKKYRTIDGSCNNVQHPKWGMAFTAQERFISLGGSLPVTAYDTNDEPRVSGDPSKPLPAARLISNKLFKTTSSSFDDKISNLVMAWGQLIDHDCIKTPTAGNFDCCNTAIAAVTPDCNAMPVPADDEDFDTCINFVRSSQISSDCTAATHREQINELTAYIDGSMVYGSSQGELDVLRENQPNDHLLKTHEPGNLLPEGPSFCLPQVATDYCQHAGDKRVNVSPQLGSMQTLLMREHNDLAKRLKAERTDWSTEIVFQETRKIIGAIIQHITYNEWLPVVVGDAAMNQYNLRSRSTGYDNTYNSQLSAQIRNAFAAAALRYGHSLIPPHVSYMNTAYEYNAKELMELQILNPHMVIQDDGGRISDLVRWIHYGPSVKSDAKFENSIRNKLFGGSDLPSRNVQRGRDHGLPPYYVFRKFCGLVADLRDISAENLPIIDELYKNNYEEIDLFVGGMSENRVKGGDVGPTFACLLAKQFDFMKRGDSFWYERKSGPGKEFNQGQLDAIRRVTMSGLLCKQYDLNKIQSNPFLLKKDCPPQKRKKHPHDPNHPKPPPPPPPPCHSNHMRPCSDFKPLKLHPWIDVKN